MLILKPKATPNYLDFAALAAHSNDQQVICAFRVIPSTIPSHQAAALTRRTLMRSAPPPNALPSRIAISAKCGVAVHDVGELLAADPKTLRDLGHVQSQGL